MSSLALRFPIVPDRSEPGSGRSLLENIPFFSRVDRNLPESSNPGASVLQKYKVQEEIQHLSKLVKGWDSYVAEPPVARAIDLAREVADSLHSLGLTPRKAVPLADGGVALVLMARPFYAGFEIYNDGEILAVFSDRKERHEAWETSLQSEKLRDTSRRLREYMYA